MGLRRGRNLELSGTSPRFAVKEAVMKVLGTGWADVALWVDIQTVPFDGCPDALDIVDIDLDIALHGQSARTARERGVDVRQLAASPNRSHAIAMFEGRA